MVLVDYCKALELVDHELLLQKLKIYGIDGVSLIYRVEPNWSVWMVKNNLLPTCITAFLRVVSLDHYSSYLEDNNYCC